MRRSFLALFCLWVALVGLTVALRHAAPGAFERYDTAIYAAVGIVGVVLAVAVVAFVVRTNAMSPQDLIAEWEAAGLLEDTEYRAVRAFQLEEWEDEGLHFFLELVDGSVLYLNGQYLYEYEATEDDVEEPVPRRFPCTEFTVRRNREKGWVVDLICRGEVLEPELVAPPYSKDEWRRGDVPDDGDVITDRTYDEIKRARSRPR